MENEVAILARHLVNSIQRFELTRTNSKIGIDFQKLIEIELFLQQLVLTNENNLFE